MPRAGVRFLAMCLSAASAMACTCVSLPSDPEPSQIAGLLFRGTVMRVETLPEHPEMRGRQRYAVTFRVEEYWRGAPARTITLYDLDPGTDCMGAGFQKGRTYLVFGREGTAKDHRLDPDFFWFGWTDVLPPGTRMLFGDTACAPGGETSESLVRKQLAKLGRGRKPKPVSEAPR